MINIKEIRQIIKDIDYSNINLEIAWQIELIIKLREKLDKSYKVIPEKSLDKKDIKKEIDIAIYKNNNPQIAIELKMPQNGAYPRRMSQAIIDIEFLEKLVEKYNYQKGYFIFLTNDKNSLFWTSKNEGQCQSLEVYDYFRNNKELSGRIKFPKFMQLGDKHYIRGCYKINWENDMADKKWKYFIIEIKKKNLL